MTRWRSLMLGAATFLVAHLVETAAWSSLFAGNAVTPWFMNSPRAGAFTALLLCIVAGFTATRDIAEAVVRALNVGLGATAALVIVLAAIGPGTLFPIAIAIGMAIVATASVIGALAGALVRSAMHSGRPHAPPS
ncbi:MAG TPA: hypothetical protein VKE96_05310 [Vicinamibacterales bacterium]|nr:hypothetical protein [Vicinamibacterales bacterium]